MTREDRTASRPHPRRRGRPPAARRPALRARRRRLRVVARRERPARPDPARRDARPTRSSSTRACPTWTASRSAGACAAPATTCRSSWSAARAAAERPHRRARGGRRRLPPASPSTSASCAPGCGRCCGAPATTAPTGSRSASCASTASATACGCGDGRSSTSRAPSSSSSSSSCATPARCSRHATIYDRVWGYDFGPGANSLRVYVGYLRRKLGEAGARPLIQTVRGVGYVAARAGGGRERRASDGDARGRGCARASDLRKSRAVGFGAWRASSA